MGGPVIFAVVTILLVLGLGGAVFAFAESGGTSKKRLQAVSRQTAVGTGPRNTADTQQQRRRNVTALLKDIEKQQAQQKQRPTLRRRLEQAGLTISPRTFWIVCGIVAFAAAAGCLVAHRAWWVALCAALVFGLGLPRWVVSFLIKRRIKAFTAEFANAIDVIVRSVKSGLPTNEALKIVAREMSPPVGPEFFKLCEGLKVGVTLEQGLKKMFENMPTAEVSFFGIVMTIQQKSGGNLSEALGNLAFVLRDRKRLQGKIKAMSSEAKASAMIIGSLPPVVGFLVWMSTPSYIESLFTERMGNLMIAGCAVWMSAGIWVMSKMIAFKH
jgi:tight adherence protein B